MRASSVSPRLFFAAFYCAYLLARANCEGQSIQNGNSKHSSSSLADSLVHERTITSEKEPVARGTTFDKFPTFDRKNFRQRPSQEVALKHQQVGRSRANKSAISTGKLPSTVFARPEMTDFVGNEEVSARTSTRRSTGTLRRKEAGTSRDSRFPRQALNPNGKLSPDPSERSASTLLFFRGDRHSRARQVDVDTSKSTAKGPSRNSKASVDGKRSTNLFGLLPFKNAHLEIVGLPGQPVRRILAFVLNAIKRRPVVEGERSIGGLFGRGKGALTGGSENTDSGRAGIHKAARLGPLLVNFDVGNP
ncbi:unnamed protein product [Xylocopa violacea]|uniref:Uncharacterized protein n=1 Tax=Xylocopa violacea TaxID=135666 RepID=A0ABP1N2W7_XYLVO